MRTLTMLQHARAQHQYHETRACILTCKSRNTRIHTYTHVQETTAVERAVAGPPALTKETRAYTHTKHGTRACIRARPSASLDTFSACFGISIVIIVSIIIIAVVIVIITVHCHHHSASASQSDSILTISSNFSCSHLHIYDCFHSWYEKGR